MELYVILRRSGWRSAAELEQAAERSLRIGNDVAWNHSPNGLIEEVRLWNVARTT